MTRTRTSPVQAVEDVLREFFAARRGEAGEIHPACAEAVAELEGYVLRGGKRVRPAFVWLGWLGAGGIRTVPPPALCCVPVPRWSCSTPMA